jgi:hypothetical protein
MVCFFWQVSVGYFFADLGMIFLYYPTLGGKEYVSAFNVMETSWTFLFLCYLKKWEFVPIQLFSCACLSSFCCAFRLTSSCTTLCYRYFCFIWIFSLDSSCMMEFSSQGSEVSDLSFHFWFSRPLSIHPRIPDSLICKRIWDSVSVC